MKKFFFISTCILLLLAFSTTILTRKKTGIGNFSEQFFSKGATTRISSLRFIWPLLAASIILFFGAIQCLTESTDPNPFLLLSIITMTKGYVTLIQWELKKVDQDANPRFPGINIVLEKFFPKQVQTQEYFTDKVEVTSLYLLGAISFLVNWYTIGVFFVLTSTSIWLKYFHERNAKRQTELAVYEGMQKDAKIQNIIHQAKRSDSSPSGNNSEGSMGCF